LTDAPGSLEAQAIALLVADVSGTIPNGNGKAGHTGDETEPTPNGNGKAGHTGDETEPTTWEPVDVAQVIAGGCVIQAPTVYARTDGVCLFYAGKLHSLNGEPESGKSWCTQHAAAQTVADGRHVWYVDFEDSPESVIGRLLMLGASSPDLVSQFTYINPARPIGHDALLVLRERISTHLPALVVIDGVTEAMSVFGLDPSDNKDTAKFFTLLPRRFAALGSAVVMVDHVVKDSEARGRWAIGAQHKMAALTGAAYSVEVVQPFGRNKAGFCRLNVTKDRPGWIRQHAAGTTVAELHITSSDEGSQVELRPPQRSGPAGFRPTVVMERISQCLQHSQALSKNALYAAIGGKKEMFRLAVELLVGEGFVGTRRQGQTVYHYSQRPFTAGPDDGRGDDGEDPF
jgi:hypothetical protein